VNTNLKSRTIGATIVLGVLLGSAACGTETVSESDPGAQPGIEARIYPPASVPPAPLGKSAHGRLSADAAERLAAAEKARQDRASTDRWARGTQVEDKLRQSGHPTHP
jgi:hypothetical protein